jgi:ferredoxin-type protein NapG
VKTDVEQELSEKLDACVGMDCDICVRFCPYPDVPAAIGLVPTENGGLLPEIREKCVGCGVCEELCPTRVITTIPKGD